MRLPVQRAANWASLQQIVLDGMTHVLLVDTTQSREGTPGAGAAAADADAMAAAGRAMQELLVHYKCITFWTAVQTCYRAAIVNPLTYTFR